jgi:hypothetical protein
MSELKWGRSDYNAETLRLADDLQDLTYGNSNYYSRIEAALEEAEERGRRLENEACAKMLAGEALPVHSIWWKNQIAFLVVKIRARLEEK